MRSRQFPLLSPRHGQSWLWSLKRSTNRILRKTCTSFVPRDSVRRQCQLGMMWPCVRQMLRTLVLRPMLQAKQ